MNKENFFSMLKEALEFENIVFQESTNLTAIEGYDSMAIMTLIAFADEHFSKKLTAKQLASVTTIHSLMELIGIENFS